MKLAKLDWNVGIPLLEQRPDTLPSVNDERLESESRRFEDIETSTVVFHLLASDLFPVEILSIGSADEQAVCPFEERRIHEKIYRFLFYDNLTAGSRMRIEVFPKGFWIFSVCSPKVIVGLSPLRVIVVRSLHPSLFLFISTHKDAFAELAFIPLSAGLPTIFPKSKRAAGYALFLGMKNWEENYSYPSAKVLKSSLINSL